MCVQSVTTWRLIPKIYDTVFNVYRIVTLQVTVIGRVSVQVECALPMALDVLLLERIL